MIRELIVFLISVVMFGGIMYLWFELQERKGKGINAKLKKEMNNYLERKSK
jgi:hypothetical protein